jgi:chemotaxis protein MotA
VGTANLFFLPAGNKLKARVRQAIQNKELMLEGVAGIVEGLNPKLIQSKLEAYLSQSPDPKTAKPAKASAKTAQAPAAGAPAAAQG